MTHWRRFRKRPIVVEAYQTIEPVDIETPEGTMHASPGDWIIRGVEGELYPCKPSVFKIVYEPVPNRNTATRVTNSGEKDDP